MRLCNRVARKLVNAEAGIVIGNVPRGTYQQQNEMESSLRAFTLNQRKIC